MWLKSTWVGFDTETTGVNVTEDRIVTAALVTRQPGQEDTVRTWLLNPGIEIPAAATAVHGISTAHAQEHGQEATAALEEIAAALAAALQAGSFIVAFNAVFDLRILEAELRRHGLATLAERTGGPVTQVIDPLVIDRAVDRYRKGKRTLGSLVAHYRVAVQDDLHAADVDVRATLDVLTALTAAHPQVSQIPDTDLFAWQTAAHKKWAQGFNAWRAQKGLPGPGPALDWL